MNHKLHQLNLSIDDARIIEKTCMEFNKTRLRLGSAVFIVTYIDLGLHNPDRADCDKRGTLLGFMDDEWEKLVESEADVLRYESKALHVLVQAFDPEYFKRHNLFQHHSSTVSYRYSRDIAPMLREATNIDFPMLATPTHSAGRYESELLLEGNLKNAIKGFYFDFGGGTLDKYIGKSILPLRRTVAMMKFDKMFYLPEGQKVQEANWASTIPFSGIDLDNFAHWTTVSKGNHLLQVRLGGISTIKGESNTRHLTAHIRYLVDDYMFYENIFETNITDDKGEYLWQETTHKLYGKE